MTRHNLITADGQNIAVCEAGEGPPLVLLHAWAMGADAFATLSQHFGATHRVVALDFRGHGSSPDCDHGFDLETLADDVAHILDLLDVVEATVLGWSMGSSVATILAHRRPDLVAALVLTGVATPLLVQRPDFEPAAPPDLADMLAQHERDDSAGMRRMVVDTLTHRPLAPQDRSLIERLTSRPRGDALIALTRSLADHDLRAMLIALDQPKLVIQGRNDAFAPFAKAEWIAANAKRVQLVAVEECGHAPFLEHPQLFAGVLTTFLDEQAKAGR